jgi:hypothetical protein
MIVKMRYKGRRSTDLFSSLTPPTSNEFHRGTILERR